MRSLALLIATWFTLTLALLGLVLLAHLASAAPAPMRPVVRVRPVERRELVGSWRVSWVGWTSRLHLREDGTYQATGIALSYAGTWGVQRGRLWLDEVVTSHDAEGVLIVWHQTWTFDLERQPRRILASDGSLLLFLRREEL